MQFVARRKADARDIAAVPGRPRQPGQVVPAKIVDSPGPLRLFERAFAEVDLAARQDPACADALEVFLPARLAGDGNDFVAAAIEHVDRQAADPARRAGYGYRSA